MKKISCAIVDDEPLAIKLIENFIGRTPFLYCVASFTDSIQASFELDKLQVDLLFLDIQMPDMDGMALAHLINPSTKIVFTTAFREYALDSYDVAAIDFLVKPIRYDKFLRAVQKAKEWFDRNDSDFLRADVATSRSTSTNGSSKEELFIRKDGVWQRVQLNRIIMVEGMKDYVRLHIEGERFPIVTHLTMKSVEDALPKDRFMRVSRSYIVSLRHIQSIDRNMCVYIGDTMVKVTDIYKSEFESFIKANTLGSKL